MTTLVQVVHDVWCAITGRCRVIPPHDATIRRLIAQERAADQSAESIRARRLNVLETELVRARIAELKRRERNTHD